MGKHRNASPASVQPLTAKPAHQRVSHAPPGRSVEGTLVYLAPRFPGLHQTYVQREVRLLRQRGWTIQPVGLHTSQDEDDATVGDLRAGAWTLYQRGVVPLVPPMLAEMARHPVRSLRTLGISLRDAIAPGERLAPRERLKGPAQALVSLALAQRLRGRDVRHIQCHFAHAATTIGMYTATQLGVPFSFTGHANDLFQRRCLLRRKLQRARYVGCISQWHRGLYEETEPDRAGKYRLIRCGVDVASWVPVEPTAEGTRRLRIATVGRLVEKKGIDTLIEALARLVNNQGRDIHLTIAGDGPLRGAWTTLAEQRGCAACITWLGDVDNARIRQLMGEADLLALPCRTDSNGDRDGIPVVLMEAMACALPVISGDLPAVRELVIDDETGLLVPGDDPEALTEALVRLADDPELRQRLGRAGRTHVLAEFALDVNIDRLERALTSPVGLASGFSEARST